MEFSAGMHIYIDKPDSLQAEPVLISAHSLLPRENYELVLRLNHPSGTFVSRAVYTSDSTGVIDVTCSAPIRGTYSGVRPMGLFESLRPCENFRHGGYCKCTPPDPFHYDLMLFNSKGQEIDRTPLIKRWLHPLVSRIEIEENGICGTLFKPPGNGPFPTIIDISGTGGGINEQKGATLASDGFCVLCLAFFQYKTLPKNLKDVDLDYFKKSIDWLISLSYTANVIGFQGVSFGALIANMLAVRYPEIRAVISINGPHAINKYTPLKEHGVQLPAAETFDEWFYYINDLMCYDKVNQHMVVPPEADINIQSAAKETAFRFVASMDDFATSSVFTSKYFEGRLRDSGHYVEVDICAGGHLMDPPYFPSHEIVFAKYAECYQAYGGEASLHGASEARVWANNVAFFKRFLGQPPKLEDYREMPKSQL